MGSRGWRAADTDPLSTSGADPFLDMPSVEVLAAALSKRHAPIKAVLLDQNGVSFGPRISSAELTSPLLSQPLCGIGSTCSSAASNTAR